MWYILMGIVTPSKAHKERRKFPFLKAFARIGTISGAAKACRISRDAVHDWRRNDESFARAFEHAKRQHEDEPFRSVESSLIFFTDVVRPIIPAEAWPKVASALAIAIVNLKNDLKGGRRMAVSRPGEVVDVSLSPNGFEEVAVPNRARETSTNDL
jgi:hypothetical protein